MSSMNQKIKNAERLPAEASNATTTKAGLVKKCSKVSEAAGSTVTASEFKALLDAMKTAGMMSTT